MALRKLNHAESSELLERMAREFAAMFARAEQQLLETLARDINRGYWATDQSIARVVELNRLRREAQRMFTRVNNQAPEMIRRMMETAAEQGALAAVAQLQGAGFLTGGAALVQSPAVAAVTAELVLASQVASRAILPAIDDLFRRVIATTTPDVLLGGSTSKQAQLRAWQKVMSEGITGFVDASGRRWQLATYIEMASRTATRRAFTESSAHQMSHHGVNLVTPVVGRDSCKSCSYWAGKILSTDGTRGTVQLQHATEDGRTVSVNIHTTVDDARSRGWQHPNCRCQLVAYLPGLSIPGDSMKYEPEREKQRQRLRELERRVRAAKVQETAAVGDQQKAAARAKVRAAQAAIREHTIRADIRRRRDREQPNLGFKR